MPKSSSKQVRNKKKPRGYRLRGNPFGVNRKLRLMRFNNSALAEAVAHLKLRLGEKMEDTAKLAVVFDIDDTIIRSGTLSQRWLTFIVGAQKTISSRLL